MNKETLEVLQRRVEKAEERIDNLTKLIQQHQQCIMTPQSNSIHNRDSILSLYDLVEKR